MKEDWYSPKQVPCVIIEGDFIPTEHVKILNIEEDISGRDLITFTWKGETLQSFLTIKYV